MLYFIFLLAAATIIHEGYSFSIQCTTLNNTTITSSPHDSIPRPIIFNQIILMPDYKITCNGGHITEWEIEISVGEGTTSLEVVFSVWRPSEMDTKYTLVGNNSLTLNIIKNVTKYHLIPNADQQIAVEPNCVIGVYLITPNKGNAVYIVNTKSSRQYTTYHIDHYELTQTQLDIGMASDTKHNEIPLVSAKIVSNNNPQSLVPTDSNSSPSVPAVSLTLTPSSSASPPPTIMDSVLLGPVIAIAILVAIIIIGAVIFVILMCHIVQRRLSVRKSNEELSTSSSSSASTTQDDKRRMSAVSQVGFPICRNPSYSSTTPNTHECRSRRAISEHVYESCYDPYEYMGPANMEDNHLPELYVLSGDTNPSRLSSSGIYEVPFGTLPPSYLPPYSNTLPVTTGHESRKQTPTCGVNNLYIAMMRNHGGQQQPGLAGPPVSPGYEVPMHPSVAGRQHSLEESAAYKEPGWVYQE